jgi:hypothetical protein
MPTVTGPAPSSARLSEFDEALSIELWKTKTPKPFV